MRSSIDASFERLARAQINHPMRVIAIVIAVSALGAWLAFHLELRTRFDQLLPDDQPSVVALRRVEARTTTSQTAMIVLEGDDEKMLRAFADAIVPKLVSLGPEIVSSAEDGVHESRDFLRPRAGLFAAPEDLEKLSTEVEARWNWEVSRATGTLLEDEPPPIVGSRFEALFTQNARDKRIDRFKDGYYERQDGHAVVVLARSPAPLGDLDRVRVAVDRMHAVVHEARSRDPKLESVRVTWTGDMIAGLVEYGAVRDDLLHVGAMGIALVLGVVVLYFMRLRALFVMATTIACGLACTFGLTRIAIGHVNIATGFLFSIVAGNGINVAILYLSRYYEEKRAGASTADAISTAHRTTWPSTSVAAIASAAAYSSLSITQFRTFRQFAFIGASGMITCFIVTITLLPALLAVVDARPLDAASRHGVAFGNLFARVVPKAPRTILAIAIVTAVVGVVSAARYASHDPMEYDLSKIQNDASQNAEITRAWNVATDILGKFNDAMVVLTDTPAQADELRHILQARENKPFEAVRSIFDFVPTRQTEKLPTLLALGARVRLAREKKMITDDDWARIAPLLPPSDLKPFGISDLPASLARPFTEKNGTRGTLVLVEPKLDENTNDLRYLLRYASSFRETRLHDGTILHGAGRALVFADILDAVVTQIPRALALSLVLTLVAVVVTFRRGAHSAAVLATLVVGFGAVATFLDFAHVHLNFLNFIALPITFGIGVDYAVNVMQRYEADGSRDILGALRTTGGAVVLCSLTTMLGYLALIGSHNQAIRSLGTVAVVGEMSCLASAVIVLPAWLLRLHQNPPPSNGTF